MHKVNDEVLHLRSYGDIDPNYYISKGKRLRNQAIKKEVRHLIQRIKSLVTPQVTLRPHKTA